MEIGETKNNWTAIAIAPNNKHKQKCMLFKCVCGTEKVRRISDNSISCGCSHRLEDIIGKVFGDCTAVEFVSKRFNKDGKVSGGQIWSFKCSCGTIFNADVHQVKTGRKDSCGCKTSEKLSENSKKLWDSGKLVPPTLETQAKGRANMDKKKQIERGINVGKARLNVPGSGSNVATDENRCAIYWKFIVNDVLVEGFNLVYLIKTHGHLFNKNDMNWKYRGTGQVITCRAHIGINRLKIGGTWKYVKLLNKENRNFYTPI